MVSFGVVTGTQDASVNEEEDMKRGEGGTEG